MASSLLMADEHSGDVIDTSSSSHTIVMQMIALLYLYQQLEQEEVQHHSSGTSFNRNIWTINFRC